MAAQKVKLALKVTKLPSDDLALTNKVYVSIEDAATLKAGCGQLGQFLTLSGKEFIFTFDGHKGVTKGLIGFSSVQRRFVQLSLNEPVDVSPYSPPADDSTIYLSTLTLEVDFLIKNRKIDDNFNIADITKVIMREIINQFLTVEQRFVGEVNGVNIEFRVKHTDVVDLGQLVSGEQPKGKTAIGGILHNKTNIIYEKAPGSSIRIVGAEGTAQPSLFRPDFNFENMGIGGLDKEFSDIFRRAFASRIFPPSVVQKLGIQHVKGILLYGPPGTGKTLMARQIGKMLNGKEPKIVNGPEILNKYVGQSEENIRNLFKEAEIEYKERGDNSDLHIIIFDELDAICKQRGTRNDGTGVGDTVVNQLLAKIDGVDALNNILLIGMTNRLDMIDEALLRPGRLEVHMEISLPDEKGRLQILKIHTRKMRENKVLSDDVILDELAVETKNFSGAEIEGLVKSAASFAFNRQIDVKNKVQVKEGDIQISRVDFQMALQEVQPAFGVDTDEFENCIRNGIIKYGTKVEKLLRTGELFVQQVRNSDRTPLVSVLIEGPPGSGKTALAAQLATASGYPYVKLISPEILVGYSETGRCNKITKIFEDAYKSPVSCVVVDDIERLLDYVRIGPRFSNAILQILLVFFKKIPSKGRKLLILGTTSNKRVLEDLEFMDVFNAVLTVPQITTREELRNVLENLDLFTDSIDMSRALDAFTTPISIKKLIMIAEMAKQSASSPGSVVDRFITFLLESS